MGLIVSVYRGKFDTGRGPDEYTLMNVVGPFDPIPSRPAALLVPGYGPNTVRVVPAVKDGEYWFPFTSRAMFDGRFVSTSDSRLWAAVRKIVGGDFYGALALHDR